MFMDPTHKCKLHPKAGLILKDCGTFPSRNGTVIHKIVVKCAEPKCNRRVGKPLMYRHTVESTPPALLPASMNGEHEPCRSMGLAGTAYPVDVRVRMVPPRMPAGLLPMKRLVLTLGFAVLVLLKLAGCAYTSETAEKRVRMALLSDYVKDSCSERETCSADAVKLGGVAAAGYAKSALMAGAIAAPDLIQVFAKPADNLTTETKGN